jgi:HK97 family phage major capsid protein
METLKKLKEQRSAVIQTMTALTDTAEAENRDFTTDEEKQFVELEKQADGLKKRIERAERVEAEQRAQAKPVASPVSFNVEDGEEKERGQLRKQFRFARFIASQLPGGKLDGVEAEIHQIGQAEARMNSFSVEGLALPSDFVKSPEKRAHDVATAASLGRLVDTDLEYVPYIYPTTVLSQLGATFLTGLRSNFTFVRGDNAIPGTWEGETDANAESTKTVENVAMTPKRMGTYATISKQLLIQSEVADVSRILLDDINNGMGVTLETAALNGSGSAPIPRGILQTSGIGDVAIGTNGGAPNWGKVVALQTALTRYGQMGKLAYLTTFPIQGRLKTVSRDTGSGIFLQNGAEMNGYPVFASENLPTNLTKGSSIGICHPILFADWTKLIIGQWGNLDIVVDPYSLATTGQVKLIVNGWWDIALRYKGSFAAILDALDA